MTLEEMNLRKRRTSAECDVLEALEKLRNTAMERWESYKLQNKATREAGATVEEWCENLEYDYMWQAATYNKILDRFEDIINEKKWRV